MVHKGFKTDSDFFFEKDTSGCSPLMNIFEKAPMENVYMFLVDYLPDMVENEKFTE